MSIGGDDFSIAPGNPLQSTESLDASEFASAIDSVPGVGTDDVPLGDTEGNLQNLSAQASLEQDRVVGLFS